MTAAVVVFEVEIVVELLEVNQPKSFRGKGNLEHLTYTAPLEVVVVVRTTAVVVDFCFVRASKILKGEMVENTYNRCGQRGCY